MSANDNDKVETEDEEDVKWMTLSKVRNMLEEKRDEIYAKEVHYGNLCNYSKASKYKHQREILADVIDEVKQI